MRSSASTQPHTAPSDSPTSRRDSELATGVPDALGVVGVFRPQIARLPGLRQALGASRFVLRPGDRDANELDVVIGWGHKPTARRARAYAERHGLPFVRVEDGFLRSTKPGAGARSLSWIVDPVGIYYDRHGPSLLESWLNAQPSDDPLSEPTLQTRARELTRFIVEREISKYNHTKHELPTWLLEETRELVLVVDQSRGDQSVTGGGAGPDTFRQMLDRALAEHPRALVLVKTHPDIRARNKRGYFSPRALSRSGISTRVRFVTEPVNPIALLRRVQHVYVCTSQLGFEALLVGTQVSCFGAAFYAGWGLTDDRVPLARRSRSRTVTDLAAAALLCYPRYVHPLRLERCSAEEVAEHLALQRDVYRQNAGRHYCFGFTPWKRGFVRRYLQSPDAMVHFCRDGEQALARGADSSSRFLAWGQRKPHDLGAVAARLGIGISTMEDAFLRSVGLGSDFTLPASLILDERGIYYDPRSPSDLEHLLEHAEFSPRELEQARSLRDRIVRTGLSKYNWSSRTSPQIATKPGQTVLLVPGQVEDDASILLGAPETCRSNAALLSTVREENPNAYLVYKPHPDVVSKNRESRPVDPRTYDLMITDASLADCLAVAQEVHTMTSLVGFEAILRGIPVVVHGRPFYAGWGLTTDRQPCPRRTRRLHVDELVAGALLRYPRYYSFAAQAFVSADDAVTELLSQRQGGSRFLLSPGAPRPVRQLNKLLHLLLDFSHA